MLMRGLIISASTMLMCVLLITVLYVLAHVVVKMVNLKFLVVGGDTDEKFLSIVREHSCAVWMTMMFLAQLVCMDSIASIYKPLIKLDPVNLPYFIVTILMIRIVLLTAVVVNSALT